MLPVTLCLEGRGTGYVGCGDWLVHDQKATSRLKSGGADALYGKDAKDRLGHATAQILRRADQRGEPNAGATGVPFVRGLKNE